MMKTGSHVLTWRDRCIISEEDLAFHRTPPRGWEREGTTVRLLSEMAVFRVYKFTTLNHFLRLMYILS